MANERHQKPSEHGSAANSDVTRTRTWAVSSNESDCGHESEHLRYVGDDGRNTYYRCGRCGTTLVSQDELVRSTRSLRT